MLEDVKALLGIDSNDLDSKLTILIKLVNSRLKSRLGGIDVPEELEHIVTEVTIIRFNKIGSEGLETHTVEGESQHFGTNIFSEFEDEIQSYLNSISTTGKGKVNFL